MLACRRLTLAFRTAVGELSLACFDEDIVLHRFAHSAGPAAPRVSARTMMNGSHAEWQRGLRFASTSEGGKPASVRPHSSSYI
jgi:hypothetical protein